MKFCLLCLRHDCNHFKPLPHLTEREVILLVLLARGLPYRAIADMMGKTPGSTRLMGYTLHNKIGVRSKSEMTVWAIENRKALQDAMKVIDGRAPG